MSRDPIQHEPTDLQALLYVALCWFGYVGLGAAYVFRKPLFAGIALAVITVAYSIAAWKERRA